MKNILAAVLAPFHKDIHCSHCGSADVRPSHKFTSSGHHVIYRCRACKHHFKVASAQPGFQVIAGVGLFVLVVAGVAAVFILSATPEADSPLPADTQDTQALAVAQAAALRGDTEAQYRLGRAHWLREDHAQALGWIKAAAMKGHAEAQFLLGQAHFSGRGTVQNYDLAQEQFTLAAQQGHLEAQYQLGLLHRDGLASPPDKETAYVWFNLAAARGHADALILRDKLTLAMTSEQIDRAQEASAQMQQRLVTATLAKP